MNAPMNTGQARVIDPVLSNVARGYRHAMFCFMYLFPIVMVSQRGGKVIEFGTEDFVKRNLERAPGSNRQRLNVGYQGSDYNTVQRALDGIVPREIMEEASAVPNIDMGRRAARAAMQNVFLQIEIAAAELATKDASYTAAHIKTLAGGSQWSHADSKPAAAVEGYKELIANDIGLEPNTMIVGPEVGRALRNNPDVVDRIKHTRAPGDQGAEINDELLAQYFNVETFKTARARSGKPGAFSALWGKKAVLAFSGVSSLQSAEAGMGDPSFGYTYRLTGYPMVEPAWFDRNCDSWLYPTTSEDTPVIAGKDAAVLIKAAVA